MTPDKIRIALDYQSSIRELCELKEKVLKELSVHVERFGNWVNVSMVTNAQVAEYIDAARKSFTERIDKDIQYLQSELDKL